MGAVQLSKLEHLDAALSSDYPLRMASKNISYQPFDVFSTGGLMTYYLDQLKYGITLTLHGAGISPSTILLVGRLSSDRYRVLNEAHSTSSFRKGSAPNVQRSAITLCAAS